MFFFKAVYSYNSNYDDFLDLLRFQDIQVNLYIMGDSGDLYYDKIQCKMMTKGNRCEYNSLSLSNSNNNNDIIAFRIVMSAFQDPKFKFTRFWDFPIHCSIRFNSLAFDTRRMVILLIFYNLADLNIDTLTLWLAFDNIESCGLIGGQVITPRHKFCTGLIWDYYYKKKGILSYYWYNYENIHLLSGGCFKVLETGQFVTLLTTIYGQITSLWIEIRNRKKKLNQLKFKIVLILNILYFFSISEFYKINFVINISKKCIKVYCMIYFGGFFIKIGYDVKDKNFYINIGISFSEDMYKIFQILYSKKAELDAISS